MPVVRGSAAAAQCLLDLGIKIDPGAIGVCKGGPVSSDGAGVLHQWEGNAGGVAAGRQRILQRCAEDVRTCCHRLHHTTTLDCRCCQRALLRGAWISRSEVFM